MKHHMKAVAIAVLFVSYSTTALSGEISGSGLASAEVVESELFGNRTFFFYDDNLKSDSYFGMLYTNIPSPMTVISPLPQTFFYTLSTTINYDNPNIYDPTFLEKYSYNKAYSQYDYYRYDYLDNGHYKLNIGYTSRSWAQITWSLGDANSAVIEIEGYYTEYSNRWPAGEVRYSRSTDYGWNSHSETASFDAEELQSMIMANFPATEYGIFDFENSFVTYADGSSESLSQVIGAANNYLTFDFYSGNILTFEWRSRNEITGISFVYNLSAVPEPDTWAMLLAGLGFVGWMSRKRQAPTLWRKWSRGA
ncbi:MAG: PEPxxWA-CTERM sorting domain-containing protein [Betaproteobacteria bacterium]|nr:PEPxxWA-CTERM sorting domain-containing protein [Betaproteobacteria bacterium]